MSEPFRVLVTDRFEIDAYASLKTDTRLVVTTSLSPQPSANELRNIDGLIIRSRTKIDPDFLDRAPQLKVIITATSGFNHIDLVATESRGIQVMFTPEANAASASELTWALVLACARRIPEAHRAVKDGDWRREALIGREVSGKTYGIVGLGRIGSRVARVAQAFGMRVVAFDPYRDEDHFADRRVERVSLDELFLLSQVVSLHVPATSETHHMIARHHFESSDGGLIFVNTSRGSVVSEELLMEALNEGWVAACGLDVFEREPLARHSKLSGFTNVVLTPHLGATTSEAFRAASLEAAAKMQAFATHGTVSDPLPSLDEWR